MKVRGWTPTVAVHWHCIYHLWPPEPAFQDAAEAVQDHPGEQARRIHCIIYT